MRLVRLFGVALTILTAGLLLANPAGAQPPSKLTDHITDNTGVLTESGRAAVSSAIDRLYHDRHIQLWVVYVDNFSRFKPENWADGTRSASGMGDHDALLAVATNTKLYTFTAPPNVLSADELSSLRSRRIELAVAAKDWSGAAVAAADGLNKSTSSSKRIWLLIAIGVAVVVVLAVVVLLLYRRRRRAARRVGPGDGQVTIDGRAESLGQALSTADARLRQISDYAARHGETIGAEAQARLDEAKRHLAAAHGRETTNETDAIAYANRASTLAAQAQTLANADVLAARRTPRRRGTTSTR
jgi:anti-sigma-K factor RskA